MTKLRRGVVAGLAIPLGLLMLFLPALSFADASSQTVVQSPTVNEQLPTGDFTITGSYTGVMVSNVKVVLAIKNGSNWLYVQDLTTGTEASKFKIFDTSISDPMGDSGNFSLGFTGVKIGHYQLRTYVVDSTTPPSGGVRTYTNFNVLADGSSPPPGYYSVAISRSVWDYERQNGSVCNPFPPSSDYHVYNLEDLAQLLHNNGIAAFTGVVISRTNTDPPRWCKAGAAHALWSDLDLLRDTYGWEAVSQSRTYPDLTTLDDQGVYDESVGTLTDLANQGFNNADSVFDVPNNKGASDPRIQSIVLSGFSFIRKYGTGINSLSTLPSSRVLSVLSVNGGACNNPSLACYDTSIIASHTRYTSPSVLVNILNPAANTWDVVQLYRLVDGKYGTLGKIPAWDCTSADQNDHWTSVPETYCMNDVAEVVSQRNQNATPVLPSFMAQMLAVHH